MAGSGGPVDRLGQLQVQHDMAAAQRVAAGEGEQPRRPDETAVVVVQRQERDAAQVRTRLGHGRDLRP
ncbi:hypothetical protein [Phenylobacterium sp.]|uniref:hypothetical protein n=1 Tax=Phenylobacterium sp. TaxID=1871053 RepID=UPI00289EEFF4|nr:hypothetical protein [Phenylobacterium sp.]